MGNITRLGVRNDLQTRRDYTSESNGRFGAANESGAAELHVCWHDMYVDVFTNDPEFDRSISNLYNELFYRPVPWINVWMDMQLPIISDVGNFTEFNQGITFMPTSNVSLSLGHQYLNGSP